MKPIASIKHIAILAGQAVDSGMSVANANPYPEYSAASHEFHASYTLAYAERCLSAEVTKLRRERVIRPYPVV